MSARELIFLQYLSAVFDHIDEAVLLLGVEKEGYRALLVNERFLSTVGYTKEDQGRLIHEVMEPSRFKMISSQYDEVVATKQVHEHMYTVRTPFGVRSFRTTLIPICNSVGTCTHIIALIRNVTTQKHEKRILEASQEALAAIESTLGTNLLIMSREGTVKYLSPALKAYVRPAGLAQLAAYLPAKLTDLFPKAVAETLLGFVQADPDKSATIELRRAGKHQRFTCRVKAPNTSEASLTIELAPEKPTL